MADSSSQQTTGAVSLFPDPARLALVTDLYELTMAAAYWSAGLAARCAAFELYFREFPPHRNYIVAAGLEQAADYLVNLRFGASDVAYLESLSVFRHVPKDWFAALREFRFSGDVWAVPEGTVV